MQMGQKIDSEKKKLVKINKKIEYSPCTDEQLMKYAGYVQGIGFRELETLRLYSANCLKNKEDVKFMGGNLSFEHDIP